MAKVNVDYTVWSVVHQNKGGKMYTEFSVGDENAIIIGDRNDDTLEIGIDDIPHLIELLKLMLPVDLVVATPQGK